MTYKPYLTFNGTIENISGVVSGVYCILNVINNKCYIGSSVNLKKRRTDHLRELRKNIHHSDKLQNAVNKYGIENFRFCIIELCVRDLCKDRENYYLKTFKPEYNICLDASSRLGLKHTQETIDKILNTKRLNPYKHTEEYKAYMSKINQNKAFSEQTKKRISEAKKGKYSPRTVDIDYLSTSKPFYCYNTETKELIKFTSTRKAARMLNIERQLICGSLKKNYIVNELYYFTYDVTTINDTKIFYSYFTYDMDQLVKFKNLKDIGTYFSISETSAFRWVKKGKINEYI